MMRPRDFMLTSLTGWLVVAALTVWCAGLATWQTRQPGFAGQAQTAAELAMVTDWAAIEPASGGESAEGGHEGGAKTAASGKKLSAERLLPVVTVGRLTIVTNQTQTKNAETVLLPAGLRDNTSKGLLERRFRFTPYAHDPSRGPQDAPLTLVEFNDLACGQCRKDVLRADAIYVSGTTAGGKQAGNVAGEQEDGRVRQVSVHLPLSRFSDTNLLAFYGKVAQRGGKYWEYRRLLLAQESADPAKAGAAGGAAGDADAGQDIGKKAFELLTRTGIDQAQARDWLMREARRFYRELDADTALGKSLGLDNPPHFYLNGLHVGDGGLPREKVAEVAQWLLARNRYQLDKAPVIVREAELADKPATNLKHQPVVKKAAPAAVAQAEDGGGAAAPAAHEPQADHDPTPGPGEETPHAPTAALDGVDLIEPAAGEVGDDALPETEEDELVETPVAVTPTEAVAP